MNEIIWTHQQYFILLQAYNRNPPEARPALLAGFIQFNSQKHPDPKTRQLLAEFYAKEALRHGEQAKQPTGNR